MQNKLNEAEKKIGIFNIIMGKHLLYIFCFFSIIGKAQVIKVEADSVIIYCSYNDLKKAIKAEYNYSITRYWVTENGKKERSG